MPQPTRNAVHINRPLTNISIAYLQDQTQFISDKVFANVPVMKQSDRYWTFDKSYWFRTDARERGLSQESAGSGFAVDCTPTYSCTPFALHKDIDDQVLANADSELDYDVVATKFVANGLALKKEKDWAAKYFTTGLWTGSSTGADIVPATLWDVAGSIPIRNIRTQMTAMKENTGLRPNALVLPESVWNILQDNADFLDRITITKDKIVTTDLLAAVLGIPKVYVAGAVNNIAAEGQTADMNFLFGKGALLLHVAETPSLMTPSAGYTFSWKGYVGGNAQGIQISRIPAPLLKSTRIEGEMAYDQKVVATDLGVYFNGVIS
jgi:hypothetical protein